MVATYLFCLANISVAQSRNMRSRKVPTLKRNGRNISVLGRAKSTNISGAQNCKIPVLSRNGRNISVLGRAKSRKCFGRTKSQHTHLSRNGHNIYVLGRAKLRKCFGGKKSQLTHFESQWSQHMSPTSTQESAFVFSALCSFC